MRLKAAATLMVLFTAQQANAQPVNKVTTRNYDYAGSLIDAAQASDIFENISDSETALIRHKASGLKCSFNRTPGERIWISPPPTPRGDDASCGSHWLGFTTSIFITKFKTAVTLDQASAIYLQLIKKAHPEIAPYTGTAISVKMRDGTSPPFQTYRFLITLDGEQVFSRLSVAIVGEWVVEERVSGPIQHPTLGDLLGESGMLVTLGLPVPSEIRSALKAGQSGT